MQTTLYFGLFKDIIEDAASENEIRERYFYVYFWIDEGNSKIQVIDVVYAKRDQQRQLRIMPMDFE